MLKRTINFLLGFFTPRGQCTCVCNGCIGAHAPIRHCGGDKCGFDPETEN